MFNQEVEEAAKHYVPSDDIPDLQTYIKVNRLISLEMHNRAAQHLPALDDEEAIGLVCCHVLSAGMSDEEKALKSFTHRNLKTLPEDQWARWKAGYYKQLDSHEKDEVFGKPVLLPPGAIIMRPQ